MRVPRFAVLLVLVLPFATLAQQPVVKDGLGVACAPGQATYTPDDNPAFTLQLSNTTRAPLYLTHTASQGWEIRLKSVAAGGKEYRVEHDPLPFGLTVKQLRLAPG